MYKIQTYKKAFTLIELLVVITIMGILMFTSYMPYEYHQKKIALLQAAREISQSLSEVRNLALYGLDTGSGNLSLALIFASGSSQIDYYAYPYTQTPNISHLNPDYFLKTKQLPRGVQIDTVNNLTANYMFSFAAITGSGNTIGNIPIRISYQGSTSLSLQKEIMYYSKSALSDY